MIRPENRTCKTCGQTRPLEDFERAKRMRFGRSNRCKFCSREKNHRSSRKRVAKWTANDPWKSHTTGVKICPLCNLEKPVSEYSRGTHNPDGLQRECKPCQVRRQQIRLYGVAPGPGDSCQICGATRNLAVDHCHQTHEVRGILCNHCNTALGGFRDSITNLENAIVYLRSVQPKKMPGKSYQKEWKKEGNKMPTDWSTVPDDGGCVVRKLRESQKRLADDIMAALFPEPPQPKKKRPCSEETKERLRNLQRGVKQSEEVKAKRAAAMRARGDRRSDESKAASRQRALDRWAKWRTKAEESGQHLSVGGHLKPPKP